MGKLKHKQKRLPTKWGNKTFSTCSTENLMIEAYQTKNGITKSPKKWKRKKKGAKLHKFILREGGKERESERATSSKSYLKLNKGMESLQYLTLHLLRDFDGLTFEFAFGEWRRWAHIYDILCVPAYKFFSTFSYFFCIGSFRNNPPRVWLIFKLSPRSS